MNTITINLKFSTHMEQYFDLPDGSYSISDIQDYFEFIIKKHETLTDNPPIQICLNKLKIELFLK